MTSILAVPLAFASSRAFALSFPWLRWPGVAEDGAAEASARMRLATTGRHPGVGVLIMDRSWVAPISNVDATDPAETSAHRIPQRFNNLRLPRRISGVR